MAKLPFQPKARLMLLLGDQLIRDAGIAVFELVKNAYDADATSCTISLQNIDSVSGNATIVIEDDGTGMDLRTVKNVWLSPGTGHRKSEREAVLAGTEKSRSQLGRLPLGEKGVGRFAVHKLGDNVTMVTRAKDCKEVLVSVDWTKFDNNNRLSSVKVTVNERTPKQFAGEQTGTRIEITDLRDMPWTRRRVRDLHRAVTSICSPIAGPESFKATLILEPDPSNWLEGLLTAEEAMQLALFRFSGRIEKGELTYDYDFRPWKGMKEVDARRIRNRTMPVDLRTEKKKGKPSLTKSQDEEEVDLESLDFGPIEIDFRIFDRDPGVLKLLPGNMNLVKDFLDQNGGVRVYRDAVRVFDFGEPGNDWLNLGGLRINVPTKRIGNNQVVGAVRLRLADSKSLIEKTSREGFVENPAFQVFRRAISFAITQAAFERNLDKERIRKATTKERQREPVLAEVSELRDEIDKLKLEKEEDQRLNQYLDRIEIQYREILEKLLTAAGAGLNLAVVLHEVEKGIKSLLASIKQGQPLNQVLERAKQLADIVDGLTWLTRQSGITDVSAADLIRHCLFAWSYRFSKHQIELTNGLEHGDPPFTVRGTRRLLMTALMNLIDNSIYWLGTKRVKGRKLYVGTTMELTGQPAFVVADNGPGFKDPPSYLTMAFFTRKPDGMGLGLHIADEVMKMHNGRVVFPEPGDVTLPKEFDGAVVMLQFGEVQHEDSPRRRH